MGDLISRSALMEDIRNTITEQSDTIDWLNLINKQPTAFDVDAVENELEQFKTTVYSELLDEEVEVINLDRAKVIVRKGGKE